MDERRGSTRAVLKQPVQFSLKDPFKSLGTLSCDISEGGLRVKLNDFIPLETELLLQLDLGESQMIECVGKVKWVSQIPFMDWYQAGVEFVETDAMVSSRRRIKDYMQL